MVRELVGVRAVVLADLLRLELGREYLFELLGVERVVGVVVLELVVGRELLLERTGVLPVGGGVVVVVRVLPDLPRLELGSEYLLVLEGFV